MQMLGTQGGCDEGWVEEENGEKEEQMGCPGNRLPPCMGESSGGETLLT